MRDEQRHEQQHNAGAFAHAVADVVTSAGWTGPVELRRGGRGANAHVNSTPDDLAPDEPGHGGCTTAYGELLNTAPEQVRRWVAAHELGHVHLGHTSAAGRRPFRLPRAIAQGDVRPGDSSRNH